MSTKLLVYHFYRKTTNRSKIKAKDDKERIQKWKQHFSLLLGKNPITTNQDIVKIVDKELQIKDLQEPIGLGKAKGEIPDRNREREVLLGGH